MKALCKFVTGWGREVGREQQSKPILILPKVILWHDNFCLDLTENPSHQSDPATAVRGQGAKK